MKKNHNRKSRGMPPDLLAMRRLEREERRINFLSRYIASRGGTARLAEIREERIQWRTVALALGRGRVVRASPGSYAVPDA